MGSLHELNMPAREYVISPIVPSDVIDSELRAGGSGRILRENIEYGLGAIYNHTPLARSLREYADMLATARQYEAHQAGWPYLDMGDERERAFYGGALLALHAEVSIETPRMRRIILASQARERPVPGETFSQMEQRRVAELLDYSYHHYGWFNDQSDDLQKVIVDTALRAYDTSGSPIADACQVEMIFGCTYTLNVVQQLRQAIINRRE